ncbi:MAG: redoxin domain-containing protein [Candidatus Sulfotelmatobacter sp.]|jgi:peroxiredoxin
MSDGPKNHTQEQISIQKSQEIGAALEDFTLRNFRGGSQSLGEFLKGKKGAVVIFWSCICSHCVRYDRYLSTFNEVHPELSLLAIASRKGETAQQICDSTVRRNLRFPILHDPDRSVAGRWFTQQTPRAFLIDANRILLYRGAIDNYKYPDDPNYVAHLEAAIREFLAGQPLTRNDTASFGCAIQSVYYNLPKQL